MVAEAVQIHMLPITAEEYRSVKSPCSALELNRWEMYIEKIIIIELFRNE
jgi:hypothetical protein